MRPVSATYRAQLTKAHRSTARLVVLDPGTFAPLVTLEVLSGTVAMARNRLIRRTCQIELANPDGAFTPRELGDWLHVNSLVRLDRGIFLDPELIEWVTLGHFLLGRPAVRVAPAGSTITVDGEDRAKLLTRSRFTAPTTYAAGAALGDVIATEAEVAGMGSERYRLNTSGLTLVRARTFEEDEPRADALAGLARDYGLELYTDADGYLTATDPPDASTAPLAWSYETGRETAIMLGLSKEFTDDRLYNHVLVTGESSDPDHPPVRAEAMDTNPASPAYVAGPLGDRLYRYTSAMITTAPQAAAVALNLLTEVALLEEQISLGAVTNAALEPGDAIGISEPLSSTEGRYLIDEITTPLGLGEQTVMAKVARSLGANAPAMALASQWQHQRRARRKRGRPRKLAAAA